MTPGERFLCAMRNRVPDRVPVTPDISNYIPCKLTGRPFWEIYFDGTVPLWKAYLDAADRYGIDAWIASGGASPIRHAAANVEYRSRTDYDGGRDAMVRRTTIRTPDGELFTETVCQRADPPSPTRKAIEELARDWPRFKHLLTWPESIDRPLLAEMKAACARRHQAYGMAIGYPGFHSWMNQIQNGVAQLSYALIDCPDILDEWYEIDLERGTRAVELAIECEPDYILWGGSGTITLASPALARKYAIPALAKWSAMTRAAGIPSLLHSCGKSRALVDMLADETDIDCINPLEIAPMGDVDLAEVKQARGRDIALMGNLHTTETMLFGSPQDVEKACIDAMRAAGHGGGFILSTGDQCGRDTPEANLFAMVETARKYGTYDQATGSLPDLPA